jgi:hypothetical protein
MRYYIMRYIGIICAVNSKRKAKTDEKELRKNHKNRRWVVPTPVFSAKITKNR